MIPPRKFIYADPQKQEVTTPTRPDNLQRMKDRLNAIKGTAKLPSFRRVEG